MGSASQDRKDPEPRGLAARGEVLVASLTGQGSGWSPEAVGVTRKERREFSGK